MKKIIPFLFTCFCAASVFAQNAEPEPMSTDRPSQGNSPKTVPAGTVQVEAGFFYQKIKTNIFTEKELHYPEALVRIGVLKFAEFRLRGSLMHTTYKLDDRYLPAHYEVTGLDDLMVGAKFHLLKNEGIIPEAGLQADFKLPIGDKELKSDQIEPKLRLNFKYKITEKLSLQYNLGLEWEENEMPESSRKFNHKGIYTLAANYNFTDTFSGFVEGFGEKQEDESFQHSVDAGVAYKVLPNLQFDTYAAFGISEAAPDFFIAAGLSFRLPK